VLAAANTAASWARARRASWDEPSAATVHVKEAEAPTNVLAFHQPPSIPSDQPRLNVGSGAHVPFESPRRVAAAPETETPGGVAVAPKTESPGRVAVATETTDRRESSGSRLARWLWLPSGGVAAVALALGGTACAYWLRPPEPAPSRPAAVMLERTRPLVSTGRQPSPVAPQKRLGMMFVTSDPVGARVVVDGRPRGVTPITVMDLTPAEHALVLVSPSGSVRRRVTIVACETAQVAESIFAGWVSVLSPFDVAIADGPRRIQLDERHQVMLQPGTHILHLENRALGYEDQREVFVKPGEITAVSIASPRSTISITATLPASVWVDGSHVGDTPVSGFPVNLGTHEVIVKYAERDERRFEVMATMKPVVLNADFSKPSKP
jgi:hypothetical protein